MLPIKLQYIWLKGLQRRRLKYEKFTDGRRRQTSSDVNSSLYFLDLSYVWYYCLTYVHAISLFPALYQNDFTYYRYNCYVCKTCLLTARDEMNNLYRGPCIDASYQASVHLAKGASEEKIKI
jgi:hypothetical protein